MQRSDVSRGRAIIHRFRVLAEDRFDYLTQLLETGRWHRYFTEAEFLDNFRDAKAAVDAWRLLESTEALPNNLHIDLSWLDNPRPVPPRQPLMLHIDPLRRAARSFADEEIVQPSAQIEIPAECQADTQAEFQAVATPIAFTPRAIAPAPGSAPSVEWKNALDPDVMRRRYSLLRKTG